MMRSMYSAVSGLKSHQTKMDVIGNNVSNVNTVAFKSSAVTFNDIMYQTIASASGANAETGTGGINAKQIGLGVAVGATQVSITTAGAAQTTGNPFDVRITDANSTNFFIVNNGSENLFTRAGSFYVDGSGNLCMTSTGYKVMGWQAVEDPTTGERSIKKDTVSALTVMQTKNLTSAPEATTKAYVGGILDKETADLNSDKGLSVTLNLYDKLGYQYTAKFQIKPKTAGKDDGLYTVKLTNLYDSDNKDLLLKYDATTGKPVIDATTGKPTVDDTKRKAIMDDNVVLQFNKTDGTFYEVTGNGATAVTTAGAEKNKVIKLNLHTLNDAANVDGPLQDIEVDFSQIKNANNGKNSTVNMQPGTSSMDTTGKGKKLGALTGLSIDTSGQIWGSYDNGNTVLLCQMAVAQFANASGLEKVGENCYTTTLNSGDFDGIGVAITADGSKMSSGQLEMSNVDLSAEFTDMITTQRGFQANSRIITVSDTLLEELVNLKR